MKKAAQNNDNRMVWPFPTNNGVRTPESQALLDKKYHPPTKPDLSDVEDAPL